MSTNRALVQHEKGGPQVVETIPVPIAEADEVVVNVKAAGLNPLDWKMAKFGFYVPAWPTVFGHSGSGVITSVGENVKNHKIGDRVFFQGGMAAARNSAFQEYAALKSSFVYKLSDSISFDNGSTFGVSVTTAAVAVYKYLQIKGPWEINGVELNKGKKVLIWGATSTTGHYAVQLASKAGATVIATTSAGNIAEVKSNGAEFVFDYRDPETPKKIHEIVGDSLTLAFDTVGPVTSQICFDLLSTKEKSTLILIVAQVADVKKQEDFPLRSVDRIIGSTYLHPEVVTPFFSWWADETDKGSIAIQESRYIGGLDDVERGQQEQIAGKVSKAKLIVRPSN
ncbi:hypothetical protein HK096_004208 [Nowakowskiella sp. JEL0078]|nr:hypothetical protein HK096_004208 [Nowakowskiella sp. JEL0078]